jgi:hypothetical protein
MVTSETPTNSGFLARKAEIRCVKNRECRLCVTHIGGTRCPFVPGPLRYRIIEFLLRTVGNRRWIPFQIKFSRCARHFDEPEQGTAWGLSWQKPAGRQVFSRDPPF